MMPPASGLKYQAEQKLAQKQVASCLTYVNIDKEDTQSIHEGSVFRVASKAVNIAVI
jgi:hypothetical protein